MAEWLKAAVLKTVECQSSVGSNPTPSARKQNACFGEMAESAEGARLLSEYGGKLPSRVRIPVSPPFSIISGKNPKRFFPLFYFRSDCFITRI